MFLDGQSRPDTKGAGPQRPQILGPVCARTQYAQILHCD